MKFKPLDYFIEELSVRCDETYILELNNIYRIESFDFPKLEMGEHKVTLKIKNHNHIQNINFNLNIPSEVNITNSSYFSLNSLIDDYNDQLDLMDDFYLRIDELSYELKQNQTYIDFDAFGLIEYNQASLLSEEVEYIIYNQNYFYNLNYEEGYHFFLNVIKKGNRNYLSYKDGKIDRVNKLYLPKESMDQVIDSRVIFHNIFGTSIDVYFNQLIDIESYLFGEYGKYEYIIEDC